MGILRIPEAVEIQGLDYADHQSYEDAKAAIIDAHKAHLSANN